MPTIDNFSSLFNLVCDLIQNTYKEKYFLKIEHFFMTDKLSQLILHTIISTANIIDAKLYTDMSKWEIIKQEIKCHCFKHKFHKGFMSNKLCDHRNGNIDFYGIYQDLKQLAKDFNEYYKTEFTFEQVYDLWFEKEKK